MQLVLIRHGKAEDHGVRLTDEERELTYKGRQKVKAVAKGLCKLMVPNVIWSSPLPRAKQTAKILADAFGGQSVLEHKEIHTGNLNSLIQKWSVLPPATTLVVVGHEPSLGQWTEQLCGVALPFKKASAACIAVTSPELNRGELVWFLQARTLAELGCKKGVVK